MFKPSYIANNNHWTRTVYLYLTSFSTNVIYNRFFVELYLVHTIRIAQSLQNIIDKYITKMCMPEKKSGKQIVNRNI